MPNCIDCGKWVWHGSKRCGECHEKAKIRFSPICPDCGNFKFEKEYTAYE